MDESSKAAIVMARTIRVMARIAGMMAENEWRKVIGEVPAYREKAFWDVIEEEQIGENQVILFLKN